MIANYQTGYIVREAWSGDTLMVLLDCGPTVLAVALWSGDLATGEVVYEGKGVVDLIEAAE